MPAGPVARPHWYSHGWNRLAYYRLAGVVAGTLPRREPPIWVKSGEEPAALTAMVATLERAVRAHPTQWFNFFDVWSPLRAAA